MVARVDTDGVVLRTTAVGESDLVVALFTRELGRVSAIARGARSSRRRFAGGLGLLVHSELALARRARGAELWSLEGATAIVDHGGLAADPVVLGHASYALELVRELAPPEAPDPVVLGLVLELWAALAAGPSPSLLRAFELALCDELGSAVALDRCAACSRGDDLDRGAVFDPVRGGAVCGACAPGSRGLGVRPLSPEVRRYLAAAATTPLAEAAALIVADDDRAAARDLMLGFVGHLVGKPLRSVAFVAQVHAGLRPT
ncbi:MAG: DNA repair protein RecO [Kofleriaceae bacterium]|nr:DNA repair protein RecO [Kofleriaceae bacterium]MCL4228396.1 DNA repair protein RecO [Myxococcales bacterium]